MRRFKRGLIFVTCFLLGFLSIVSTPQAQETKDVKVTASQISVNDLVTPSKPDELSDADKRNQLKILLRWPGSIPYRSYFVMLPKKINLNEIGNAEFNNITNSRSIKINPYSENKNDDTGIQFTVPQGFEKMPDTEGLCVVLDGIGRRVPVRAGETFAEYFAHGLVTRLVLGEYAKAWKAKGANIDLDKLDFGKEMKPNEIALSSEFGSCLPIVLLVYPSIFESH